MTKKVITVSPETSLFDAANILYKNRFSGLPVVDESQILVGLITEYDLINANSATHIPTLQRILKYLGVGVKKSGGAKELETLSTLKVRDIMNPEPLFLRPDATVNETIMAFTEHSAVNPVPIVDQRRKVVGIISRSDLVKFFIDFPHKKIQPVSTKTTPAKAALDILVEKSSTLLESRISFLQSAIAATAQGILITTPDAEIIFANDAWEKISGYSKEEMIGKNPGQLWGGQMPKEFYQEMWRIIKEEKKPFVGEVKNRRKDGTEYWQEMYISPILDEKGEIKFFISIEPEITTRKEREKFREEFISIIGHQLRNPLASIRWMVELLAGSAALAPGDRETVNEIYKQNKGLADLVDDILILSRVSNKNLKKEQFDLKSAVAGVIKEVQASNSGVQFSFEAKGENFYLIANKPMALQVFSNLVYNAAEYSDKTAGKVEVKLEKKDGNFIFSCHNNGPEIKEEDKPKIFSKFFRSDEAKARKETGTGLGLFIIKTICDNFGWEIWFESEVDKGTTFYVKIPKAEDNKSQAA